MLGLGSNRLPFSLTSSAGSRFAGLVAGALALAACAQQTAYYPGKSDAKPHPRVARAQKLPIHGIDVSRWQGKIDWASVRAAGTKFAFIKATEGGDHLDPRFLENWYGAAQAGVPRGAYHFMYWCRPAHEQAAWFRRNVPRDPNALPPVLDLEWNGHSRTCPVKVPRETALAHIRLMLKEMEAHTGKRPIIYTDITFHREVLEGELHEYPHWVRSVAAEPHERYAGRRWTLWQYTTTGRVPGISGDVDRNVFYGSQAEWAQFLTTDRDPRHHTQLASQSN
jgi:lysozyme